MCIEPDLWNLWQVWPCWGSILQPATLYNLQQWSPFQWQELPSVSGWKVHPGTLKSWKAFPVWMNENSSMRVSWGCWTSHCPQGVDAVFRKLTSIPPMIKPPWFYNPLLRWSWWPSWWWRASWGMGILVRDCIFSASLNIQIPLQSTTVHLNLPILLLIICNIYVPQQYQYLLPNWPVSYVTSVPCLFILAAPTPERFSGV
jgi:hypothetical protein